MIKIFIISCMFFCHIIDDYYLQGILASMKQKIWWTKQTSNPLYNYDYIMALCEHAFSWTFMIFLPAFIACLFFKISLNEPYVIYLFCFNWGIHAIVDDLKANQLKINLIQDQLIHICQVIITGVLLIKT